MGFPKDSAAARQAFRRQLEARRESELENPDWKAVRRGWFFGSEELKQELLARASKQVGAQHYGSERRETDEAKAELKKVCELDASSKACDNAKKVQKKNGW